METLLEKFYFLELLEEEYKAQGGMRNSESEYIKTLLYDDNVQEDIIMTKKVFRI